MIDKVLDRVQQLKSDAKFDRDFGDYKSALGSLLEALDLLRPEYESLSNDPARNGEDDKERLRRELADCYGMAGGLYRRMTVGDSMENLRRSEEMYREGLKYERDDTYNLTNSIVIPILRDPGSFDYQKARIDEALKILHEQVRGKRKDQWWAWADLGLLTLLSGDLPAALEAYAQFRLVGARAQDYESTIQVLEGLSERLQESNAALSQRIKEAIQYLMTYRPES
jgi:tetratricopeptide (TPR) repeat protein